MSTVTQAAVLRTIVHQGGAERERAEVHPRPLVRLATFAALGCFGVIEWGTLIAKEPTWRLLGLLGIALGLVAVGPLVHSYRRLLGPCITIAALLAALAVCGVPLSWIRHVRLAVTADEIGQGLSALPRVFIPYSGINRSVHEVILLGAAVLLLDGALLLAFAPAAIGDLRRAGAALPLVALAVVPATLVRPPLPYLDGLVLFILLAAFMWGERVRRDDVAALLLVCVVLGIAAMALAPSLDRHKPWINYQALAAGLVPGHVDRFDWSQQYGPLRWPRTGHTVLEVTAKHPDYWKAEDLDLFDGRGWASANFTPPDLSAYVTPSAAHRWTQTIQVTLRGMSTTDVIGAGEASPPDHTPGFVTPGVSAGTWTDTTALGPGDSYRLKVYAPQPTPPQLAQDGTHYPASRLQPLLSVSIPLSFQDTPLQVVAFAPFGSRSPPENTSDVGNFTGVQAIADSPYAPVYALAERLRRGARTPYAYVERVWRYLQRGFTYYEDPPPSSYPLVTFLLQTKLGYCQQFAGAMALLLRMGGIPARVAAGFTSGTPDGASGSWLVSDRDAHSWVEAWFPRYGWVQFDPTPAVAPARGGKTVGSVAPGGAAFGALPRPVRRASATNPTVGPSPLRAHASSGVSPLVVGGALAVLIVLALALTHGPAAPSEEDLLSELERALARSGRPISADITLAELEDRFGARTEAAGYVRTLRLARFAGGRELPSLRQRRAVRAQLRSGLGVVGALRALWALPPRWRGRTPASGRPRGA